MLQKKYLLKTKKVDFMIFNYNGKVKKYIKLLINNNILY